MDYKTGSRIMLGQKYWQCECCKKMIPPGDKRFVRIVEDSQTLFNTQKEPYQRKTYTRWHITCACMLNNLNDYEKRILGPYILGLHKAQDGLNQTIEAKNDAEYGPTIVRALGGL